MHDDAVIDDQTAWNRWNLANRQTDVWRVSTAQADVVEGWLKDEFGGQPVDVLEVGCGTGWMSERLTAYGHVTAIDIADEAVAVARQRAPAVEFVVGDFVATDVGLGRFDVVVGLETMAHVADQQAFVRRCAEVLRPGGVLMLSTQNRDVMERNARHLPNPGWHRHWVDRHELRDLLNPHFVVRELRSITPMFFDGPLRVLSSNRAETAARRARVWPLLDRVRHLAEQHFLGWSLMCLATKRTVTAL